jgi:response regulator of citrate/malate metabolism
MLLRRIKPASKVVELEKLSELQAAIIKNGAPELFILDLLLPGVKGVSAITEHSRCHVPGNAFGGHLRHALWRGGGDLS